MAHARNADGKPTGQKITTAAQSDAKMKWDNRQDRKAEIREKNIVLAAKRTPQEQIKRLDDKFGKGVGAVRERRRLLAQIENKKQ